MLKFFQEPLLHFLLIGAALFILFDLVNEGTASVADREVVVSAGRIEQLSNIFARTWQRPATPEELKGLIDDFVLEEIYYRQAVAMGIDRGDTVIRRRLRQKFEFLTDDMAAASVPTENELKSYLLDHADVFVRDSTYSFEQIYINPDRREIDLEAYLADQLAALRSGKATKGDAGLLPAYFDAAPARAVNSSFGFGFSDNLDALPAGVWQGPVESGLGLHLIRLDSRIEGTLPSLDEIRPVVEREWANTKRLETRRIINEQLLNEYDVTVEWQTVQSE